jgi:hypothetical protein
LPSRRRRCRKAAYSIVTASRAIQMPGIMRFNGLREPKQAFVVTDGGNVGWNNRRYCADQIGNGWHRIRPHETRQTEPFWPTEPNWRPDPSHPCMTKLHLPGSGHRLPGRQNDDKSL